MQLPGIAPDPEMVMEVTARLEMPPLESIATQQLGANSQLSMFKPDPGAYKTDPDGSQPSEAWAVGQKRPRDEGQIPQPGPQGFMSMQQQQPHGMLSPVYAGQGGYA